MLVDWQKIDGTWYYLNFLGHMLTGWKQMGVKWYFYNGNGALNNQNMHVIVDGDSRILYLASSGEWIDEVREGISNQIVTERNRSVSNNDASIDNQYLNLDMLQANMGF